MKNEFDGVNQIPDENAEQKEWVFDGVAHTQGEIVLENDEFEIVIPASDSKEQSASDSVAHPAEKPKAKPVAEKTAPAPKKKPDGNKAKFALIAVLVALCIAVTGVLGYFYYNVPNSDEKMNPGNIALTVNNTDVSIGMYNYYYSCVAQRYISYAQYGYYQDLDPYTDFSQQETTDENGNKITWADMFTQDTMNQLKYITSYYEAAIDAGLTLTDEQQETIKTQLDSLKEMASEADQSVDEYIKETYGDYCGYATLSKMLEQCLLAESYYQQSSLNSNVTDEEVQKYYEEHKEDFLSVPFAYLQVVFDGEEITQADAEKKAKKYAKQIKSVEDMKKALPKACDELIAQYVGMGYFDNAKEASTALAQQIETTIKKSDTSFSEDATKWLFSNDVKKGACSTFTDTENHVVYIVLKTAPASVDEDKVYSVRHILVMPKDDEGNALEDPTKGTKKQFATAKKEAEALLAEFNKTDKSEKEFAALADAKSEDVESTSNGSSGIYGGLIAGARLGEMVKSFEDWSTDKSRNYGDVDIVESSYGYHVMFYIENVEQYLYDCKQAVTAEKEEKFVTDAKVREHKGAMKKVKVQEPMVADQGDPTDDDSENMDY